MAKTQKKKPYVRVALLGMLSLISYYLLLTNQTAVTDYFIKGGIYAALPIITALYFSFVHGAFASGVLTLMGISAKGSH
jgi:F0F1-type ATP synthase assembly protein I